MKTIWDYFPRPGPPPEYYLLATFIYWDNEEVEDRETAATCNGWDVFWVTLVASLDLHVPEVSNFAYVTRKMEY